MARQYSSEVCRRLADVAEAQDLHRPRRVTRHEAGDTLELDLTGVAPAWRARVSFQIERYVGGGFAGQVYRARVVGIAEEAAALAPGGAGPIRVGAVFALKMFIPWSRGGRRFRDALYGLAFQAPFSLQVSRDAVRAAALWQKLIRRGAAVRLGGEQAIVDVHATFHDARLGSMGMVLEWVEGRVWRLEANDRLLARASARPPAAPPTEYAAKRAFMRRVVALLDEVGAAELARQYEWWTMKSQPNVLQRIGGESAIRGATGGSPGPSPATGLVAVDFAPGLALLPFLPMSPGDVALIARGVADGRPVQFDRGDLGRLDAFIARHAALYADLGEAVAELRERERAYRASQMDVARHGTRLLTDHRLHDSILRGWTESLRAHGTLDPAGAGAPRERRATRGRAGPSRGAALLLIAIGFLPLLGRFLQRLWGSGAYRRHVTSALTSWGYLRRALCAKEAELLIEWHRRGRAGEGRALALVGHPVLFWLQAAALGWLPPGLHRLLVEPRYAWDVLRYVILRPVKLYFDAAYRRQWLAAMVQEGRGLGMLGPDEADRILARVDEPYIQKYLQCLAAHVCTLPVTQLVSVSLAVIYLAVTQTPWAEAWKWAVVIVLAFQVIPISPGSLARGLFVVYVMLRERQWHNYRLAAAISFWKYVGYLGFPIQMISTYPVIARFMAARWAMGATHLVPVFGEHGALLEYGIFTVFFNVPISLGRRWDQWQGRRPTLARLGSLGGLGRLPGPTGTYASFLAAALLLGLYHLGCPWWALFIVIFPVVGFGISAAGAAEEHFGRRDPRPFVLDEVVGMMIAGLAAWGPAFLAGIARAVEADAAAWSAIGRGAWLGRLAWLPGEPWAWAALAAAFVWFRVCDIVKPPPARQAERLHGGWGVMADDVIAGAMALALALATVLLANRFLV